MIGDQLFGLPISRVQDVFVPDRLTRVPLAPPEVAGMLNLRGRIVTAIDMRRRLGLPPRDDGKPAMAVGIEIKGESYGLLIDTVGEVMKLRRQRRCEPNPVNLDRAAGARRRPASTGSTASSWSCSTSITCSTLGGTAARRLAVRRRPATERRFNKEVKR